MEFDNSSSSYNENFLLDKTRMIILGNQFRHSLRLEESQHIGEGKEVR